MLPKVRMVITLGRGRLPGDFSCPLDQRAASTDVFDSCKFTDLYTNETCSAPCVGVTVQDLWEASTENGLGLQETDEGECLGRRVGRANWSRCGERSAVMQV